MRRTGEGRGRLIPARYRPFTDPLYTCEPGDRSAEVYVPAVGSAKGV